MLLLLRITIALLEWVASLLQDADTQADDEILERLLEHVGENYIISASFGEELP